MNQSQREDDTIKKLSILPPIRQRRVQLLCSFDGTLADESIYNREPITWGRDVDIAYYPTGLANNYYVAARGNSYNNDGTKTARRHNNAICYDISDVDLSGPFCIDFWTSETGTYGGTPMCLIPLDYDGNIFDANESVPTLMYRTSSTSSECGFFTYNPVTGTRNFIYSARSESVRHVAVTRDYDNTIRWFNHGTLVASYPNNTFNFTAKVIQVSRTYSDNYSARINTDGLRIVTGTPWYTSNFTPSTESYTTLDVE